MSAAHEKQKSASALPPKTRLVLLAVSDLLKENRIPPTMREIADRVGMVLGVAHRHVVALEREGWISRIKGSPRSIQLLRPAPRKR